MAGIDGRIPPGAAEITTGQANRVWYVPGPPRPYILKHYRDPARAANEAAALTLLARYGAPAPRLLTANLRVRPAWTAQSAVHATPIPAARLTGALPTVLRAVHAIPGSHAGRLSGATKHSTWPGYLHSRLEAYTNAAPDLTPAAKALRPRLETAGLETLQPRLLHHDLQPGHLMQGADGTEVLIDWELAAFGDPLSDLARLAVRLRHPGPGAVLSLNGSPDLAVRDRLDLYWRIHLLADAAFATDTAVRAHARALLSARGGHRS
ncbi:hypothetical protein GCM10009716_05940 [Streptomyces sodiiphilus]|uniref:Aminoglycoside phosphotransferase domain-containing protein n=1 Tax=Streptomyces sodiiphilus TaxID=226217 RepID=A0ABP5A1L9_9ACTN